MGKAQSKRSVDITTEGKKDEEVVAGKVEKIEDAEDQKPQVNGDATPQESDAKEKKENEESENDKDATTEKSGGDAGAGGGGDAAQQNGEQTAEEAAAGATTPKDEVAKEGAATPTAGAEEEISPLADESSKKTKKEKVKKKWSFRSISFGKKDKQKPAKSDTEAVSPTTNGEATDKPAEGANVEDKKEEGAEGAAKPTTENGEASEKELLNGDGDTTTTTPTEDKSATAATNDSTNETAATGAAAATTTNNTTASSSTTTSPSTAPVTAAADNQTENKVAIDVAAPAPVLSNGTTEDIKEIADKPQQNGTNGEGHADEHEETHAADIKAASKSIESDNVIYEAETTNQGDGAGDESKNNLIDASTIVFKETKTIEDIGAGGDIGENKLADKLVEPPPLPISPPPSQVVVFALNNEVTSAEELEQSFKEKEQVAKVPIAEIEELTDNLTEIPKIVSEQQIEIKQHISQPLEDIQEQVEQMELEEEAEKDRLKDIELEQANINKKELEASAAATFLIEEVTNKAAEIVTEMQNVLEKQHEELAEKLLAQVDEEDDLPPPPPTPPATDENNIEDNLVTVEEVLNQFETKLNEIEQKVMSFEGSVSDEDEASYKEDERRTISDAIIEAEKNEIISVAENEEKSEVYADLNEATKETEIETNSIEKEYVDNENELPPPPPTPPAVDETKTEVTVEEVMNQFETKLNEIEQKVIDFEIIANEKIETETNKSVETSEIEITENETQTNANEMVPEIETTNETQEEQQTEDKSELELKIEQVEIDTESIVITKTQADNNENGTEKTELGTDQLVISNETEYKNEVEELDANNKLNLNDKVEIETANIIKFDDDSKLDPVIDSKTVKEINPIELKEAAAAEIKTQDLAVSCE